MHHALVCGTRLLDTTEAVLCGADVQATCLHPSMQAYIPPPNVVDAAPRLSLPSQKAVAERPSYALGPPLDAAPDADAGDAVA